MIPSGEANDDDGRMVAAATYIQARQRGCKIRTAAERKSQSQAAALIQARHRGRVARKPRQRPANKTAADGSQIHVRGIGVHGWDGTEDGRGDFESAAALKKLMSSYGTVIAATIRHRVDMGGM